MKLFKLLLLSSFTLVTSCGISKGPIKLSAYAGNDLSIEEAGVLKCIPDVKINSIDGNPNYSIDSSRGKKFRGCEIKLKPGKHTINLCHEIVYDQHDGLLGLVGVDLNNIEILGCEPQDIVINVVAGRVYKIETHIAKEYATSFGVRKGVSAMAGPISIVDVTERERSSVYYNLAKEQSVIAKNKQNENKWAEATTHWSNSLEYAKKGEIGLNKIAKIQLRYGRSLAAICKYEEAINHLTESYNYYNENAGYAYEPLLSIANIYYEQKHCSKSLNTYEDILNKYKLSLDENDSNLLENIQSNYKHIKNNTNCQVSKKVNQLYYRAPYGSQC